MAIFGSKKDNPGGGGENAVGIQTGRFESPFAGPGGAEALKAAAKAAAQAAPPAAAAPKAAPTFGIEETIQLMRTLPTDQNVDLVMIVVKTTLASLKVNVQDIIADAARRQGELETRVATLKSEIANFEKEIENRRKEIGSLEATHAETTKVKGHLERAPADAGRPLKAAGT
ncbi:MAG: hypothetical protein K1X64_08365 [Myxococcaceae bacterium]|nr:hypothetical protein [Myxococcaceae bacterium]